MLIFHSFRVKPIRKYQLEPGNKNCVTRCNEGFLSEKRSTVYKTNLVRDIESALNETNYLNTELSKDTLAYTTTIINTRKITSRNSKPNKCCFDDNA